MDHKTKTSRTGSRIEFLDSVRGIAALAVLFSHAVGILAITSHVILLLMGLPLFSAVIDGKAAVAMFFVLSGFVLSRPYLKSASQASPRPMRVVPFYAKRITRIYLPFLCALSLSAVAKLWWYKVYVMLPPKSVWFHHFWNHPLTWPLFIKQCFFMVHQAPDQLMIQDWSLGVELKASAILPILLFLFKRGERWLLGIALLLFFWPTGAYYISFILGIFLAAHVEDLVPLIKSGWLKLTILIIGLACYQTSPLLGRIYSLEGLVTEKLAWTATSFGCVLILLAIFSSRRLQLGLNHGVLVFLGRISYGVYLLQLIFLMCFIPWLVVLLNRLGLQTDNILVPIVMVSGALVTIAAATFFYKVVEEPAIRLGHKIASHYNARQAKA